MMRMKIVIISLIVFLYEVQSENPIFVGGDYSDRINNKEQSSCFEYKKEDNKIILNLCNQNYKCPIQSYLPTENENIKCEAKDLTGNSIEGESCKDPKDCASNKCVDGRCVGLSGNEQCIDHLQCAKETFCSSVGKCESLKTENSECSTDFECQTDLLCFNGKCTKMFSQPLGTEVEKEKENSLMCTSGLAVNINQKYICSSIQMKENVLLLLIFVKLKFHMKNLKMEMINFLILIFLVKRLLVLILLKIKKNMLVHYQMKMNNINLLLKNIKKH